ISSSAYCRSVLYPLAFRVLTMLSPSAIQRAEDLVGMEMPIVPLSSAKACGESDIRPRATVIRTNLNDFIFIGGRKQCVGRTRARSREDRRLHLLCKEKLFPLAYPDPVTGQEIPANGKPSGTERSTVQKTDINRWGEQN